MTNPEIINDISLLYELSLSVGKSLDLEENAASFITALMRRKGLSYAALWLKASILNEKDTAEEYKRIYAYPNFHADKVKLSVANPVHKIVDEHAIYVLDNENDGFGQILHGREAAAGRLAILRLGDIGFLKLFTSVKVETLEVAQLYKLQKVLDQFTLSLKACILHRDLTREIQERKQIEVELRQSKEVEEQFFANMSHEIRTPLNGILGIMNLMLSTELTAEQKEYVEDMILSSKTLLAILNDILDFSKIQQGKISLENVRFDLRAQLSNHLNMAKARADADRVLVRLDVGINVPRFVMGDQFRLDQVMNNLLSNAIKFTEEGEINIVVKYLGDENDQSLLLFQVQDTGIGIPEDRQEKIFSNFIQAEKDTTRRYGGSGLGLSIVKQLVTLMNGDIRVDSELGFGSTFYFTVPFEKCSQELPKGRHSNPDRKKMGSSKDLEGVRILLVEDTPMNQKVGKRILQKWGAEVEVVENGKEAFESCKEKVYDLVLMDLQMPVMSGYEATEKIRQELEPPMSKVPIIALTAAVRETVKKKVLESGMDTYVMKPFEPDNLLAIIKFYLRKQSRREIEAKTSMDGKMPPSALDISYLEEIAGGDEQFIRDMLALFRDQAPIELESLGQQIDIEAWELIHQHTHKLKYPYTSIGRVDLVKRLSRIERITLDGKNIQEIQKEYEVVRKETKDILEAINERT